MNVFIIVVTVFFALPLFAQTAPLPLLKPDGENEPLLNYHFSKALTAPTSFKELSDLKIPEIPNRPLFNKMPPVKSVDYDRYAGPDGGVIVVFKSGTIKWKRTNGTFYHQWGSRFTLSNTDSYKAGTSLWVEGVGSTGGRKYSSLRYADGSMVVRVHIEPAKYSFHVVYPPGQFIPTIVHDPSRWSFEEKLVSPFRFLSSPAWAGEITKLSQSKSLVAFTAKSKEAMGFETTDPINAILFSNPDDFFAVTGVRNELMGVSDGFGLYLRSSNASPTFSHALLFHESTHYFTQRHCQELRKDQTGWGQQTDSNWFYEGLAEVMAMQADEQTHSRKIAEYSAHADARSSFRDINQKFGLEVYAHGTMMVEYLRVEYGFPKVRKLFEEICKNQNSAMAVATLFKITEEQLLNKARAYFKKRKPPTGT